MLSETVLKGEVTILGVDVNKVVEIDDMMEDAAARICRCKVMLSALVFGNPSDLFPNNTFDSLKSEFEDVFGELESAVEDMARLNIIRLNENLLIDKYKADELKEEVAPIKRATMDDLLKNNESPF